MVALWRDDCQRCDDLVGGNHRQRAGTMESSMSSQVCFSASGLSKSFFGVTVLRDLSISVGVGEVLGLVGENGAGKSTLMNIIAGNLPADSGQMILQGNIYDPHSVRDAIGSGVAIVHQELNLFENLSVAENLFVNNLPTSFGVLRHKEIYEKSRSLLQRVGLRISPKMQVAGLSSGERQLLEIAKALSVEAKLILLDEPTTSLSNHEATALFQIIRALATQGVSIVLITHAIADVLEHCHRVNVLRDGQLVADEKCSDVRSNDVVTKMVGRPIDELFPASSERNPTSSTPSLLVEALSRRRTFQDISFHVNSGEIVGLFGLVGSGRSEVARAIAGCDRVSGGRALINGETLRGSARRRIADGLAYITESRREDGICAAASVADNMTLVGLRQIASSATGWLWGNAVRENVAHLRDRVKLQATVRDKQPIRTLSGGNQQKIVIGKWLLKSAKVYIFDEPTRGIDVGAKREIYEIMQQFAGGGCGLLVISSDIEELIGICDRILVMSLGKMRGEFSRRNFDRVSILEAAFAGHDRTASGNNNQQEAFS
jgi:ribose transport system ATP-binding protein